MQRLILFFTDANNGKSILAIVRIIVGLFMAYHGLEVFSAEKMKPYADWEMFKGGTIAGLLPYLGKGAEFVGGLMMALGAYTRVGALIVFGTMTYITFFVGKGKFWYEDQHPFLFALLALIFLFLGSVKWGLTRD